MSAPAPVLVPEACAILKRAVAMCVSCDITLPHRNKKIRLSKKKRSSRISLPGALTMGYQDFNK
jgi:hypothetical protein